MDNSISAVQEQEGNGKKPFPKFGNGKGMKKKHSQNSEKEGNEKNISKIREREGNEKRSHLGGHDEALL